MEKVKNWKKCLNCGGYIPQSWNKHAKCGWNINTQQSPQLKITPSVKAEVKVDPLPSSASNGQSAYNGTDNDKWIIENYNKSFDILHKCMKGASIDPQINSILLSEIMRERQSEYMNAKIELQKLQHMDMMRKGDIK